MKHFTGKAWIYVLCALAGGALLETVGQGHVAMPPTLSIRAWLEGWLAYTLLLGAAGVSLDWMLRYLSASSSARWAAWTALWLRLLVGLALIWLLPVLGYADNEASQAGYLYKDAARRDNQAIALARSDKPLLSAFTGNIQGDQYGGLLALSAGVYRYLSPSEHRAFMVVLLAAWAMACGTAWLWAAGRDWLAGEGQADHFIPNLAAWIFCLYPEAVFLGSSQMREPFVIAAIAAACYGLGQISTWKGSPELHKGRLAGGTWLVGALLFLFVLQPPVGLAVMVVLSGMWLVDALAQRTFSWKILALVIGILMVGAIVVIVLWTNLPSLQGLGGIEILFTWLANNFGFQTYLTERASGMVQYMIGVVGKQWLLLIVLVIGVAQPVLPAVLVEPSVPIWTVIGTLRAAGWYLLVPLILYGTFSGSHPATQPRRALRLWLGLVALGWILVAAANAGGDFWDNPRYRTIFLPWLALLAAWAVWWARQRHDPWLWRWLAVEAVFVLFFLWWYISRYYPGGINLSIWFTSALTLVSAAAILLGGWLWDMRAGVRRRRP